ncbi:unnamed protein product [Sphagnum balticum]
MRPPTNLLPSVLVFVWVIARRTGKPLALLVILVLRSIRHLLYAMLSAPTRRRRTVTMSARPCRTDRMRTRRHTLCHVLSEAQSWVLSYRFTAPPPSTVDDKSKGSGTTGGTLQNVHYRVDTPIITPQQHRIREERVQVCTKACNISGCAHHISNAAPPIRRTYNPFITLLFLFIVCISRRRLC